MVLNWITLFLQLLAVSFWSMYASAVGAVTLQSLSPVWVRLLVDADSRVVASSGAAITLTSITNQDMNNPTPQEELAPAVKQPTQGK